MWSGPRNVSTALMYSFAQRHDACVVDEPLYGHYLRVTGVRHPGREQVLAAMDTDGRRVMSRLAEDPSDSQVLFAKQMAHHWTGLDARLLEPFEHFLLIRDPRHMLPSLAQVLETVTLEDTGLPAQIRLLDQLRSLGKEPFCLDARDLLRDPARMLAATCARLGLDFDAGMTEWDAGPRREDGVWAPWWYANVHRSTGFRPYRPGTRTIPEDMQGLLNPCDELYSRLRRLAIQDPGDQ
jgi:hypothetical protein